MDENSRKESDRYLAMLAKTKLHHLENEFREFDACQMRFAWRDSGKNFRKKRI